ncbi:MAG: hypothetical protein ACK6BG_14995 [Cyanobacteriota bacterium]
MKVELTKKMKKVLQDPKAIKNLQQAMAEGGDGEIAVGRHRYKLVPLVSRDIPINPTENQP